MSPKIIDILGTIKIQATGILGRAAKLKRRDGSKYLEFSLACNNCYEGETVWLNCMARINDIKDWVKLDRGTKVRITGIPREGIDDRGAIQIAVIEYEIIGKKSNR